MEISSSGEESSTCSADAEIQLSPLLPEIVVENSTQIFTELLELKQYEDGYQVTVYKHITIMPLVYSVKAIARLSN